MSQELTPYSDPRDITPYVETPHAYPAYSVRYDEQGRALDLHSIWGFVRRNWWILAAFLLIGVSLAVAYNRTTEPVFQASATIQVKDEQTATDPTGFNMMLGGTSDIATDMMVLRSRTLAEEVVDSLQLQARLSQPRGVPRSEIFESVSVDRSAPAATYEMRRRSDGSFELRPFEGEPLAVLRPGEPVRVNGLELKLASSARRYDDIEFRVRPYQSAVNQVRGRLEVDVPGKNANAGIIQITYRDNDLVLAASVPNAIAEQFIVHRRREHKRTASNTVAFLRGQLDTLSVQLRDAEERLRDYREASQIVNIEAEGTTKIGQLAAAQAQRDQLSVEYSSLAQLRSRLTQEPSTDPLAPSPYRRIIAFPGLLSNASLSNMLSQLTALENERSELLERRTMDDPQVVNLTDRIGSLEDQIQGQVDTYLEGLSNQLSAVSGIVGRNAGQLSTIPRKEYELAGLTRQAELYQAAYIQLQTRLKEAEITQAVEDPNVGIVDLALAPKKPIKPRRGWNIMIGMLLGLVLGVGASYTREFLDTRIHTREELRDLTAVPVLGLIPRINAATISFQSYPRRLLKTAQRDGGGNGSAGGETGTALAPRLVAEIDRTSAVSEAYRSLRTNITFSSTAERLSKIFVLTSPTPKDGKTTTAANLAVTFAQQGLKVLLVDADMRRGILHKLFRLARTPGLSNILVENCEMERAIQWAQLNEGTEIDVLPTGTVPPNPAELLSSSQMKRLMDRLRERYDAIVFDTPPLTLVTDAAILASFADTVLLVARANKTEQGAISFAMEQLRNVGAPVRGAVLNDVDFKRDSRYGRYGKYDYYAYSYDYGRTED